MSASNIVTRERALVDRIVASSAGDIDRRKFFVTAGAAALAPALIGDAAAQQTASLDRVALAETPVWQRQRLAGRVRDGFQKDLSRLVDLNGTNQGGQYWNYSTYITPNEDFYLRNEYPTPVPETDPRVDRAKWRLIIHGDAVERPIEITYEDLLRMPSRSQIAMMECAGNGRSLFWEQQDMLAAPTEVTGTGWGLGGIGQAEWQYVPMDYILGLVGLKKNAKSCLFWSGVDGKKPGTVSDTGRPVPINTLKLRGDSVGLAFKMNGQDLPADHGGPVRAIVPGWCGAASTKWLTEIKIASHDFWVPLNSLRHVMMGPDYKAPKPQKGDEFRFVKPDGILGPAVTWGPPRSMLTIPLVLDKQPKIPHNYPLKQGEIPRLRAGLQKMRGYAWAPQWGVKTIEVQVNGRGWQTVRPIDPIRSRYAWTRFDFPWNPMPGRHVIETRVTDTKGTRQPVSVPYNKGGFDFWAIPKFHIEAV
jgi:sulfane dehydrogenase subunit SoxC